VHEHAGDNIPAVAQARTPCKHSNTPASFITMEFTVNINKTRYLAWHDNMVIWQERRTILPSCVTACRDKFSGKIICFVFFTPSLLLLFVIYCEGKMVAGPAPQNNMRYADCGRTKCTTSGIGL
jgi:hypothetical protein